MAALVASSRSAGVTVEGSIATEGLLASAFATTFRIARPSSPTHSSADCVNSRDVAIAPIDGKTRARPRMQSARIFAQASRFGNGISMIRSQREVNALSTA